MGLDDVVMAREDRLPRSSAYRYQRLRGEGDDDDGRTRLFAAGSVRLRRRVVRRMRVCKTAAGRWRQATTSGGGKRLLRLRLRPLLFLLPAARRMAALFLELVRRLAVDAAAADCPSIVFSSQWGLPVLSHSASTTDRSARLRAFYLERSLSARSNSSTAGSPC